MHRRTQQKDADMRHAAEFLRARCERRRHADDKRDEYAALR